MVAQATQKKPAFGRRKQALFPALEENAARVVIDEDGSIVHTTESFAALAGGSIQSLRGQPVKDVLSFAHEDHTIDHALPFAATILPGAQTVTLKTGGHPRLLQMRFDPVTGHGGRTYVIGACEEGPATPALLQDKDAGIFLSMGEDILLVTDLDGTICRINEKAVKLIDQESWQKGFLGLIYDEDTFHVRTMITAANMLADSCDARVIGPDGQLHWMRWHIRKAGEFLYINGRDITEIKEQETNGERQDSQLREAQAIAHMGHWRWVVGSDDVEWSEELYCIFGVSKESFSPTLDSVGGMIYRRDNTRLLQVFQRAMIERQNYDMDFRITRPDGETRYIVCEGRCELDEHGEVHALFGIMQDITQRMLHEQELRSARDAAQRAYAAKSRFLANMSHELRTPLNAIIGFSEMMQGQLLGPIGTEKYIDYVNNIHESGTYLLDLIGDILDMSKIEAGKYELDREIVNMSKLIRTAVHMTEGRAEEAGVAVTINEVCDDLQIVADRRALLQILLNILSNAVKFTENGGYVRIDCAEENDGFIDLRIADTGIGIPAHKIRAVLRPFEQAEGHYTREHEGTGLGLAITKDLVELHGGSLSIDSAEGKGTTVTVRIPVR